MFQITTKYQFFCNRMHAPFQYRRKFTNAAIENLEKRKEIYDKHGQHISVTLSPIGGGTNSLICETATTFVVFQTIS